MFHDYTKLELAWVVIKSVIIVILKICIVLRIKFTETKSKYTIYNIVKPKSINLF